MLTVDISFCLTLFIAGQAFIKEKIKNSIILKILHFADDLVRHACHGYKSKSIPFFIHQLNANSEDIPGNGTVVYISNKCKLVIGKERLS